MRTILLLCTIVLLYTITFGQQFQLEWQVNSPKQFIYVGDIDGDDIGEFYTNRNDSVLYYDAQTHGVDFVINGFGTPTGGGNVSDYPFGYIDYNQNGIKDFYFIIDNNIYLIDPNTMEVIHQFILCSQCYGVVEALADFDNDGIIELHLEENNGANNRTHYIYSTGIQVTSLDDPEIYKPANFKLYNNYSNPFNPSTAIRYSISSPEKVSIKIYDVSGQLIKDINEEHNQA